MVMDICHSYVKKSSNQICFHLPETKSRVNNSFSMTENVFLCQRKKQNLRKWRNTFSNDSFVRSDDWLTYFRFRIVLGMNV